MTPLFSQEFLSKSIFKWQELAGKELVIRVGIYPDEIGKGGAYLRCWSGQNYRDKLCFAYRN